MFIYRRLVFLIQYLHLESDKMVRGCRIIVDELEREEGGLTETYDIYM
jgi:hypothetical protein